MSNFYNKKLIKSGDVYEVYDYERAVHFGETRSPLGRGKQANEEGKKENRKKTLNKAKTMIRRLINANVNAWGETPKFLTLTFADNVQDVKQANYEFKKFRQRLEYMLKFSLKYVVVVEFQKRGAVHYHAVFFNLPYIDNELIAQVWKQGFIKINRIEDVDNIGAYVTKYMTKDDYEESKSDRLVGQKSYFTARNLKKPVEVVDKKEIERIESTLKDKKVYESEIQNDYVGLINYKQYNTKRL